MFGFTASTTSSSAVVARLSHSYTMYTCCHRKVKAGELPGERDGRVYLHPSYDQALSQRAMYGDYIYEVVVRLLPSQEGPYPHAPWSDMEGVWGHEPQQNYYCADIRAVVSADLVYAPGCD